MEVIQRSNLKILSLHSALDQFAAERRLRNCLFGTYRAAATKVSSLSITSQNLQPSEFVIFVVTGYREFVCYSEFPWQIITVGALQLKNDDKLKEESFLKLMGLSFRYLPLLRRRGKD
jgi:hypothetical protein